MKKPIEPPDDPIGTALDNCSWDYTAPAPIRRFFLNPMSAFFGDFPWEGRKTSPTAAQGLPKGTNPASEAGPESTD